jgi:hypothetical protein
MAASLEMAVSLLCLGEANLRSISGRKRCSAMARFIASKSARLPTSQLLADWNTVAEVAEKFFEQPNW